jgi:hypothetical protein
MRPTSIDELEVLTCDRCGATRLPGDRLEGWTRVYAAMPLRIDTKPTTTLCRSCNEADRTERVR